MGIEPRFPICQPNVLTISRSEVAVFKVRGWHLGSQARLPLHDSMIPNDFYYIQDRLCTTTSSDRTAADFLMEHSARDLITVSLDGLVSFSWNRNGEGSSCSLVLPQPLRSSAPQVRHCQPMRATLWGVIDFSFPVPLIPSFSMATWAAVNRDSVSNLFCRRDTLAVCVRLTPQMELGRVRESKRERGKVRGRGGRWRKKNVK